LEIDGKFECHTLEDTDRGLTNEQSDTDITANKVFGKTAIPTGQYEVIMNYSKRFDCVMPLLLGVKGFEGIRIHLGNTEEDTHGCILVGIHKTDDDGHETLTQSGYAFLQLKRKLLVAAKKEKVFITIL
jgi:hypothetical protein